MADITMTSLSSQCERSLSDELKSTISEIDNSITTTTTTTNAAIKIESENINSETKSTEPLEKSVYGIVKWYNVKFQYGFISRLDTKEDVFVHKNGIKRSDPYKIKSIADGEPVMFDLFHAEKGPEARNVTGPNGRPAKASKFAHFKRNFMPSTIDYNYILKQTLMNQNRYFKKYGSNSTTKSKYNTFGNDKKSSSNSSQRGSKESGYDSLTPKNVKINSMSSKRKNSKSKPIIIIKNASSLKKFKPDSLEKLLASLSVKDNKKSDDSADERIFSE